MDSNVARRITNWAIREKNNEARFWRFWCDVARGGLYFVPTGTPPSPPSPPHDGSASAAAAADDHLFRRLNHPRNRGLPSAAAAAAAAASF